jgi:hypothetical protein
MLNILKKTGDIEKNCFGALRMCQDFWKKNLGVFRNSLKFSGDFNRFGINTYEES